jgi:hypothetical protein
MLQNIDVVAYNFVKKFLEKQDENLLELWEKEEKTFRSLFIRKKSKKIKKNASVYNFFCKAERSRLKEINPDISEKDIRKELSELWITIKNNEDEISIYKQQAEDDKKRYEEEKNSGSSSDEGKKKKIKDKNRPKRALSAYILFGIDERVNVKELFPTMKATDVSIELGKRWKNIDTLKKSYYEKKALEDKKRFDEQMSTYIKPVEECEPVKKDKEKKGKKTRVKKVIADEPVEEEPVEEELVEEEPVEEEPVEEEPVEEEPVEEEPVEEEPVEEEPVEEEPVEEDKKKKSKKRLVKKVSADEPVEEDTEKKGKKRRVKKVIADEPVEEDTEKKGKKRRVKKVIAVEDEPIE